MDKKEARDYIGTNHHFHPEMNPGTPPKQHWWNHMNKNGEKKPTTQPIMIQRQLSANSEGTGSPTASPVASSPMAFTYPLPPDANKKPKIYKTFDFSG